MRIHTLFIVMFSLSACASTADAFKPLTLEQSALLEAECGRLPVSVLKSAESPRKILYRSCKRDALNANELEEEIDDVS